MRDKTVGGGMKHDRETIKNVKRPRQKEELGLRTMRIRKD